MRRRIVPVALVVASVVMAAACGGDEEEVGDAPSTTTTTRRADVVVPCQATAPPAPRPGPRGPIPVERFETKADGKLTVGAHLEHPPLAYLREGTETGFEVDLVEAIGERMELDVDVQKTGSLDALVPRVVAGTFDTAISGITIPTEPIPEVVFSDPFLDKGQAFVVREAAQGAPGADVGVVDGSASAAFAQQSCEGTQARPFASLKEALDALAAGDVDGVVAEFPDGAQTVHVDYRDRLRVAELFPSGERFALPVAEVTPGLLGGLNTALDEIREDGTYAEIVEKWFGALPP